MKSKHKFRALINPIHDKNNSYKRKRPDLLKDYNYFVLNKPQKRKITFYYGDDDNLKYCPLHGCNIEGLQGCDREFLVLSRLRVSERRNMERKI